ncbi:MAG: tRNA (adenosine(37)-N6)-dimethylallyltransferase MiaA [Pseudomonadota bacterium]
MNGPQELAQVSRAAPVLIAGPTASGKSALALALADRDGRVIINADALQVHSAWRLLSARPSPHDEDRAPHALYGHVGKKDAYSVGHWLREVAPLLAQPVVIVGGTGLYFMALTEGLAVIPPIPPEVRAEADARRLGGGIAGMIGELDAATASGIDLANPARIQRAWEVWRATGRGLADWQRDTGPPLLPLAEAQGLVLQVDRDRLNGRIDARLDAMMVAGALDEVRANAADFDPATPWARAIGAAELMQHLTGALTRDSAVAQAKLATRQYAKRQRTWFRSRMRGWTALQSETDDGKGA